jgi:hypothetical protein
MNRRLVMKEPDKGTCEGDLEKKVMRSREEL